MSPLGMWVMSDDSTRVGGGANGQGRGDGYDVDVYASRLTGRHLVRVYDVRRGRSSWYVCPTRDDAEGIVRPGCTPGSGPGRSTYVSRPAMLREVRALRAEVES